MRYTSLNDRVQTEEEKGLNPAGEGPRISRVLPIGLALFASLAVPYALGIIPAAIKVAYLAAILAASLVLSNWYRHWLVRPVIIIIGCVGLTVTFVDVVARRLPAFQPVARELSRWPAYPRLYRYQANRTVDRMVHGDLLKITGNYHLSRRVVFETDSRGFRNDLATEQRASSEGVDVVLLGDSFGAGIGVSQQETWARLLADRYGVANYNLSLGAASLWQELINLKLELGRLKLRANPVLIWMIFVGNDLDGQYGKSVETPELLDEYQQFLNSVALFRQRSPVIRAHRRLLTPPEVDFFEVRDMPMGGKILFVRDYILAKNRTSEQIRLHEHYPRLKHVFREMGRFAKQQGLAVRVVMVPTKAEIHPWLLDGSSPGAARAEQSGFSQVIQELCQGRGFFFLDLKPPLLEYLRPVEKVEDLLYLPDDSHWNVRGNRAVAEIIHEQLLQPFAEGPHSIR